MQREREDDAERIRVADVPESRHDRRRGGRGLLDRQGGQQCRLDVGSIGGIESRQPAKDVGAQCSLSIEFAREKLRGLLLNVVGALVQDAADQIPAAVLVIGSKGGFDADAELPHGSPRYVTDGVTAASARLRDPKLKNRGPGRLSPSAGCFTMAK